MTITITGPLPVTSYHGTHRGDPKPWFRRPKWLRKRRRAATVRVPQMLAAPAIPTEGTGTYDPQKPGVWLEHTRDDHPDTDLIPVVEP